MKKIALVSMLLCALVSCKSAKDDFRFEKLTYHSGPCFGSCPSYHLEINADQSVRLVGDSLYGKRVGNRDLTKVGFFTGKIADPLFEKLQTELRKIGLDTLAFRGVDCCDAPMKTIIVYYNGKRKYLRAMFPPEHARALITALSDTYSTTRFTPTPERFAIEMDSIPGQK